MNAMAYNKRLLYYARRTSDLEKILHIFDEMLEAGHKDIVLFLYLYYLLYFLCNNIKLIIEFLEWRCNCITFVF